MRTGKKGERKYSVVVREKRSRRDGRPVTILGSFEKNSAGAIKKIDMQKIEEWQAKGAQLSTGVKKIL